VFFSNFVPKMHRFWDIRLQKCRDLENRVRGPSRSLEISPFDRAHMTSYWRSVVTMVAFVKSFRTVDPINLTGAWLNSDTATRFGINERYQACSWESRWQLWFVL